MAAPLTLEQLLEVKVAVRGEAVPHIRSFVAQSPHPSSSALQDLLTDHATPRQHEVTLPLREVLTLVTLIKSVQDEVGVNEGNKGEDSGTSSSTPSSPISTVTSLDPLDYVPLIRSYRHEGKDILHEADPDEDEDEDEDDLDDLDEEEEEDDAEDEEKGKRGGRFSMIL